MVKYIVVLFSCPTVSDSSRPHGLQHAGPLCPLPITCSWQVHVLIHTMGNKLAMYCNHSDSSTFCLPFPWSGNLQSIVLAVLASHTSPHSSRSNKICGSFKDRKNGFKYWVETFKVQLLWYTKIINIQFVHNLKQLGRCIFPGRVCYPDDWGGLGLSIILKPDFPGAFSLIGEWSLRDNPTFFPLPLPGRIPLPTSIFPYFSWEILKFLYA